MFDFLAFPNAAVTGNVTSKAIVNTLFIIDFIQMLLCFNFALTSRRCGFLFVPALISRAEGENLTERDLYK
jgi:hypothetical protein